MLRGRVDMLYEIGVEALDSLTLSTQAKTFTLQRPYAFLVLLNVRSPKLQDKALRRALNAAIDRPALVAEALKITERRQMDRSGHIIGLTVGAGPFHVSSRPV